MQNGSLWCWGSGTDGRLGTGGESQQPLPAVVEDGIWGHGPGRLPLVDISIDVHHTCAVVADGPAWCWGRGANDRLGNGGANNQARPVQVSNEAWEEEGMLKVTAIATGDLYSCAIVSNGSVWC